MPVSQNYREGIGGRRGAVVPALKWKGMFGGVGVYSGASFFALLDDDRLYFKVDDSNRGDFEAAGTGPFCPFPDKPDYVMQYYEVPVHVFDDSKMLREWAAKAVAVAKNKPRKKSSRKKKA